MTGQFRTIELKEILRAVREPVRIVPSQIYRQVTVRLNHKGVILRTERKGRELRTKQYAAQEGQFIISRIDARNGAMGLVPHELNGAIVTNDFLTYDIDGSQVLPKYLDLVTSTKEFVEICGRASEGTTNRVRLKRERFLEIPISIPPLDEQEYTVAKIQTLTARIKGIHRMLQDLSMEIEAFWQNSLRTVFSSIEKDSALASLESICIDIIDTLHSTPKYNGDDFPCIRSQDVGWGTIDYSAARRVSKEEFVHRVRRGEPRVGDIVYVREGDVGRCGIVDGSQHFCLCQRVMLFRPYSERIDSRFLMFQLMSPTVLNDRVLNGMTGTTSRHVNIGHLRKVKVSIPSLLKQKQIAACLDSLQRKIVELKRLHGETEMQMEELIPSILEKAFRGDL